MTNWTVGVSSGAPFTAPARFVAFRRALARLLQPAITVELDEHLANDVGQRTYKVPLFAAGFAPVRLH